MEHDRAIGDATGPGEALAATLVGDEAPPEALVAAPKGPRRSASKAARLALGAVVGRYVVVSELGAGGMGVVYAAYDPELDRKVALKLLSPQLAGGRSRSHSEARARLIREAHALARLAHPNVVAIYDVGEADSCVWLAMEHVDGLTLDAWLQAAPRATAEVLEVMIEAGRGLAAAHLAGLLHRDFKPLSAPPPTRTPLSQQIGCNPTNSGVLAGVAFSPEGLRVPAVCPEPGKNQAKLRVSTRWCRRGR
ncbi:MAG: protein kinase [Nannocystis sp.]|nr:protein kinase [Nannocystis sp.]